MRVSHHFKERLQERFAKVANDYGVSETIEVLKEVFDGPYSYYDIGNNVIRVDFNLRIRENEKKYKTHKMIIIATNENDPTLITVLKEKMVRHKMG